MVYHLGGCGLPCLGLEISSITSLSPVVQKKVDKR
jgi:hypothetical protein